MTKIFLSYAREDRKYADLLYSQLAIAGFHPFLDTKDIVPGENWSTRIKDEIKKSDYFLVLLSEKSTKKRGYLQKEIRLAFDMWDFMLENDIYLIPVRLDNCVMPDKLSQFQWVDLFAENGIENLIRAIRIGETRRHSEDIASKNITPVEKEAEGLTGFKISHPFALDFIYIPAGKFVMGSAVLDKAANKDEQPSTLCFLENYWISKFPISNEQYYTFVKDTSNSSPAYWDEGNIPPGKNNHPVLGVSWKDACRFCEWLGLRNGNKFRLPTEAEWEKAARGYKGQIYPWGDRWSKFKANYNESAVNDTTEIGHYSPNGDSPYGMSDAAGNVWEWCSSLYRSYPYRADDGREDLGGNGRRVIRGGSFSSSRYELRCTNRNQYSESFKHGYIGFRLVREISK